MDATETATADTVRFELEARQKELMEVLEALRTSPPDSPQRLELHRCLMRTLVDRFACEESFMTGLYSDPAEDHRREHWMILTLAKDLSVTAPPGLLNQALRTLQSYLRTHNQSMDRELESYLTARP